IFEQSQLATETGAAIHLAPNANGLLRRLGIYAENFGANPMQKLTEYTPTGETIRELDLTEPNKKWLHPWLLAHRIDLHNNLKKVAENPTTTQKGIPLHKGSRIAKVDAEKATITLENGTEIQGDVIVGADGVHSVTRSAVPG
ncbi:hypothetical protein F66182_16073, partial [Fusarium sp. NRRL 66182]